MLSWLAPGSWSLLFWKATCYYSKSPELFCGDFNAGFVFASIFPAIYSRSRRPSPSLPILCCATARWFVSATIKQDGPEKKKKTKSKPKQNTQNQSAAAKWLRKRAIVRDRSALFKAQNPEKWPAAAFCLEGINCSFGFHHPVLMHICEYHFGKGWRERQNWKNPQLIPKGRYQSDREDNYDLSN